MEKTILKRWPDVVTVPEEVARMAAEYKEQGYDCKTIPGGLMLTLEDGVVAIYWEDGAFWQVEQTHEELLKKLFEEEE